jgi:hypothetical protein
MRDLRPAPTVHATITERGAMLLDLRGRGRWFALTASGAYWWACLTEGATPGEASDEVAEHFGADPDAVRADMSALAERLTVRGLLCSPRPKRRWRR